MRNRAINSFTHQWDWEIRHFQQGMKAIDSAYGHTMKEIRDRAKLVEEYIAEAPKWDGSAGATYRGIAVDKKAVAKLKRQLKSGPPPSICSVLLHGLPKGIPPYLLQVITSMRITPTMTARCAYLFAKVGKTERRYATFLTTEARKK